MTASAAALLACVLAASGPRGRPSAPGGKQPASKQPAARAEPVQLSGDALELQQAAHVAVYTGHVEAVRRGATLHCDRLTGWFDEANQPLRFRCEGHAEALQRDTRVEGEVADFDNLTGKVVVTGDPRATRAGTRLSARRFTFDTVRDELFGEEPTTVADSAGTDGKSVNIRARTLRVDQARGTAVWSGDVRVLREGAVIQCSRLVAHSGPDGKLSRAACTGHARLEMGERWATGERADYDVAAARVLVTGNPVAGDGVNVMTGSRFTVDVTQKRILGENVRARLDGAAKGKR